MWALYVFFVGLALIRADTTERDIVRLIEDIIQEVKIGTTQHDEPLQSYVTRSQYPLSNNVNTAPQIKMYGYSLPPAPAQSYNMPRPQVQRNIPLNPNPYGNSVPNTAPYGYSASNPAPYGYSAPNTATYSYSASNPVSIGYSAPNPAPLGYSAPNPAPIGYSAPNPAPIGYSAPNPIAYDYTVQEYLQKKPEVIYVPVVVKKKKKKKMKIITIHNGFYIPGGTQLFGKFKTVKDCAKACAQTPTCFAGDYNPWFKKCYSHSNYTACAPLKAHTKLIHFKKVPCSIPEAPQGRVMLGVQIHLGLEVKAKSLTDCLKKCANAGKGIQAHAININLQLCFGIDYDFSNHKCYFHVNNNVPPFQFCPANGLMPGVPRDAVPNPAVVSILLCPGP